MVYLILKGVITATVVVGVSELAKRSSLFGAILASLPLTSILAMIWLYTDSKNVESVKALSVGIFWMVVPSLFFFIVLPLLLKMGLRFYPALVISCAAMSAIYWLYVPVIRRLGVEI